jgi:hypothetical protein
MIQLEVPQLRPDRPNRPVQKPFANAVVQRRLYEVLARLEQARRYAGDVGADAWQFAVALDDLKAIGLTANDLRWLMIKLCVELATEIEPAGQQRQFRIPPACSMVAGACLVITPIGQNLLAALGQCSPDRSGSDVDVEFVDRVPDRPGNLAPGLQAVRPRWDYLRCELHFGDHLIKRFRLPAPNQKRILAAFEEEHWPPRIDDPLSPHPEIDSKRRLHHTLIALNRNQKQRLIQFQGDGTGEGICWAERRS